MSVSLSSIEKKKTQKSFKLQCCKDNPVKSSYPVASRVSRRTDRVLKKVCRATRTVQSHIHMFHRVKSPDVFISSKSFCFIDSSSSVLQQLYTLRDLWVNRSSVSQESSGVINSVKQCESKIKKGEESSAKRDDLRFYMLVLWDLSVSGPASPLQQQDEITSCVTEVWLDGWITAGHWLCSCRWS